MNLAYYLIAQKKRIGGCGVESNPVPPPPESVTLTTRPPGLYWLVSWSNGWLIQYLEKFYVFYFFLFFFYFFIFVLYVNLDIFVQLTLANYLKNVQVIWHRTSQGKFVKRCTGYINYSKICTTKICTTKNSRHRKKIKA